MQVKAEGKQAVPETLVASLSPQVKRDIQNGNKRVAPAYSRRIPRHEAAMVRLVEEQCRSFCLALFFREQEPVCSLGITSSIPREGKSFVAFMMAHVLANDSTRPVILTECDWEHAGLHDYFGLPATPGLAEWLRGECTRQDIRHKVNENLTIIPAGDGQRNAVRLLQQVSKRSFRNTLAYNDENLLVELPAVTSTSYSIFAASMVEALALVVRAGVTPDNLVADASAHLNNLPLQGIILNQVNYRSRFHPSAGKNIWLKQRSF